MANEMCSDAIDASVSDDYDDEECMSDADENFSDEDEEQDELGGTQVNVDITRRLWTLREGTFEGVDGDYVSDGDHGSPRWRACPRGSVSLNDIAVVQQQPCEAAEAASSLAAAADASAASTPNTVVSRASLAGSEHDDGITRATSVGSLIVNASGDVSNFRQILSPRPLTDANIIAEAHARKTQYGPCTRSSSGCSGDEFGYYAEEGEVQRITADDGFDLEQSLALQEDGLFTARQRRWMKIPDGNPGPRSPMQRPASALDPGKKRGKQKKWRSQIWVPFPVIVAALPACDSPQIPMAKVHHDEVKRKHIEQKVGDCERAAAKAVAQGRFLLSSKISHPSSYTSSVDCLFVKWGSRVEIPPSLQISLHCLCPAHLWTILHQNVSASGARW